MRSIEYQGQELYLPSSVSIEKGKKPYDYSSNWSYMKNGRHLEGKEYRFTKGSPEHTEIRELVEAKYGYNARPAANEDIKLIDKERVDDYLKTPTPNCKITGIVPMVTTEEIDSEARVSSLEIAEGLGIEHESVCKTIMKQSLALQEFGVFRQEIGKLNKGLEGRPEKVYYLNKDQCELLVLLSKNSPAVVAFKVWIIKRFNELNRETKEIKKVMACLSAGQERLLQDMLCLASSYSETPLVQEVVIDDQGHRVDLMLGTKIAIELKTSRITPCMVTNILLERDYLSSLKRKFADFQTLILCSTAGISEEAVKFIEHLSPRVVYEDISQVVTRLNLPANRLERFSYLLEDRQQPTLIG